MSSIASLPGFIEVLVAVLVVLGAAVALIGSLGLLRLKTFYERVHPPTMGGTLGIGLILAASILMFSTLASRLVLHEVVIAIVSVLTTPVAFTLLMRAALHRDAGDGGPPERSGTPSPSNPSQA